MVDYFFLLVEQDLVLGYLVSQELDYSVLIQLMAIRPGHPEILVPVPLSINGDT